MRTWHWCILAAVAAYFIFGHSSKMPLDELDRYDSKAPLEKSSQHIGASCYKDRCLMIYVAPWCTYCRRSHQAILSTVKTLESRGIPVFVVLGMDKIDKLKDYAAEFPFPVYFDRDRHFFHHLNGKGVPYFVTWAHGGKILKHVAGGFTEENQLLQYLELTY